MSRKFYELDSSKPDFRCLACSAHQYIILDYEPERNFVYGMHTVLERGAPTGVGVWIHWWLHPGSNDLLAREWKSYPNFYGYVIPKCLDSYKEIKI